nr:MAG TPA: hypothetical protein [Caudoviricetes sp.]
MSRLRFLESKVNHDDLKNSRLGYTNNRRSLNARSCSYASKYTTTNECS